MFVGLLSATASIAIEAFCAGCACGISVYVGKTPLKKILK